MTFRQLRIVCNLFLPSGTICINRPRYVVSISALVSIMKSGFWLLQLFVREEGDQAIFRERPSAAALAYPESRGGIFGISSEIFEMWRRGRDSNPRWPSDHSSFQDCPFRPLTHLSLTTFLLQLTCKRLRPKRNLAVFKTARFDRSRIPPWAGLSTS